MRTCRTPLELCRRACAARPGTGLRYGSLIGLRELPHQATSGSAENRNDGTGANLDRVSIRDVLELDLVVVEDVNSDRASVQNITDLGTYIHQSNLVERLEGVVLACGYRVELAIGEFVNHSSSPLGVP